MQLFAAAALLRRDLFNCVDAGIIGKELLYHFIEQLLSTETMQLKCWFVGFGLYHVSLCETLLCLSIKEGGSVP